MEWKDMYDIESQPEMDMIQTYVHSPLWDELVDFIEGLGGKRTIEYSKSCNVGWNVKYKKSGKSLVTLYPGSKKFTALVIAGKDEMPQADLLMPLMSRKTQKLYHEADMSLGNKWLMFEVDKEALQDIKKLIILRTGKKKK